MENQESTKKKESSWINMFKNFSLTNWDNSKPKVVSESSCRVCNKSSEVNNMNINSNNNINNIKK